MKKPIHKAKRDGADKAQVAKFVQTARALECDESEKTFDSALGKIGRAPAQPKPAKPKKKRGLKLALPDA
jgi:hypothetical protein